MSRLLVRDPVKCVARPWNLGRSRSSNSLMRARSRALCTSSHIYLECFRGANSSLLARVMQLRGALDSQNRASFAKFAKSRDGGSAVMRYIHDATCLFRFLRATVPSSILVASLSSSKSVLSTQDKKEGACTERGTRTHNLRLCFFS
jgi:hypothetical protein